MVKRNFIYNIIILYITSFFIFFRYLLTALKKNWLTDYWLRCVCLIVVLGRTHRCASTMGRHKPRTTLFTRRRCTHRGASVCPRECIGRPSARRARRKFISHIHSDLQKEETKRNQKKPVSAYGKIKCLNFANENDNENENCHPEGGRREAKFSLTLNTKH